MSVRACRDCGDKVSTKAGKCPHCGTPRPAQGRGCFASQNCLTVIIAVIIVLAVMVVFAGASRQVPMKANSLSTAIYGG